jgi:hypothetical protein
MKYNLPASPPKLTNGVRTPSIQNVAMDTKSDVMLDMVMASQSEVVMLVMVMFDNKDIVNGKDITDY